MSRSYLRLFAWIGWSGGLAKSLKTKNGVFLQNVIAVGDQEMGLLWT